MIGGNGTVVNANNLTNNGGVIFSGADIDLTIKNKLQNLNSASVYARGDVTIGSGTGKTAELLNQSSTIRGDKNVHIAAGSLTNEKREFITGWDVTETDHDIALPASACLANIIMPGAIFIALCRMAPFIWTALPPIFFPVLI